MAQNDACFYFWINADLMLANVSSFLNVPNRKKLNFEYRTRMCPKKKVKRNPRTSLLEYLLNLG